MDQVWTGVIIALFGAFIGAFLGAYIKTWFEWLRRPILNVSVIERPKGRANKSILYFAIGISNNGKSSARNAHIILSLQDHKNKLLARGTPMMSSSSSPDGSIHPNQIDEREIGTIDLEQKTISVDAISSHSLNDIEFPLLLTVNIMAMDTSTVTSIFVLDLENSNLSMIKK